MARAGLGGGIGRLGGRGRKGAATGTPTAPVNTAIPVITGTPSVGETLTASAGSWTGFPAPTFAAQWKRGGVDISGAISGTYVLQAADLGTMITVTVTATNASGSASATSAAVGPVAAALTAPVNSVLPAITGTAAVGQTLTSSTGTWSGNPTPTYTYQWLNAGVAIGSATSSTYALQASDEGDLITVTVTATNSQGSAGATSAATGPIGPLVTDVGGAALLTSETDGFATDFTYATDANRVCKKVASVKTEYGTSFFTNAGTSTKWVYNAGGTLVNVAAGSLALDYDPVTHAAKGLLVEPQATNLCLQSSAFDNAPWSAGAGATVTGNNALAPNGLMEADRVVFDGGGSVEQVYQAVTQPATTHTRSIYIKGTVGQTITLTDAVATTKLHTLTGGWDRVSISSTDGGYVSVRIGTASSETARTVWLWGAQVESGSVATSCIPTTSATVTRAADAVTCLTSTFPWSAAGSNSIVSNAAGNEVATAIYWTMHDGTDAERYVLDTSAGTKKARLFTADASVTQTDLFGASTPVAGTFYKVGVALATNDFAGSIDGGTVATDAVGTMPTVTTLQLGGPRTSSTGRNIYLKSIKIVPRRMTNGQLQTETT
jgi:hypothetical protein